MDQAIQILPIPKQATKWINDMQHSYSVRAFLWRSIFGFLIFACANLLVLIDIPQLDSHQALIYTLSACTIPYLITGWVIQRLLFIPPIEGNAIILLSTLLPFGVAAAIFSQSDFAFSWPMFLSITLLTALVYRWSYQRHIHTNRFRFVFINQNTLERFLHTSQFHQLPHRTLLIDFVVLNEAIIDPQDVLVWDPDESISTNHLRQLTLSKYQHLKILSLDRAIELLTARVSLDHLNRDFISLEERAIYGPLKRVIDFLGAIFLLALLSPLLMILAIMILSIDGRPIFFRQKRVGLNGKIFNILKFRTMDHSSQSRFARPKHDTQRITSLGQWLRHHRLDELPQLYNVIQGEMSLIGPRPEYAGYARLFRRQIPHYAFRHLVKPGITGWAQVQQGHNTGPLEATIKLTYDLYYVKHYSLILDLLIAFKTLRIVITGFGAK